LLQDAFLVVNARGIKASTADPTWRGMRVKMDHVLTQHLHPDHIYPTYYDYGRVWGPPRSSIADDAESGDVPLYALKYLRQVTTEIMNIFTDAADDPKNFTYREYPAYFLCGTGDVTIEPHEDTQHAHIGYMYGQFYNTVKNFWAAGDNYFGANRGLDDLGLDPEKLRILHHAAQAAGGGHVASSVALINAFLHLLGHVDEVSSSAGGKSSAVRDEHRSRGDFFSRVDHFMTISELHQESLDQGFTPTEYAENTIEGQLIRRVFRHRVRRHKPGRNAFLCLQTSVFLRWTAWNINRFAYGIYFIFSQAAQGQIITWEQTRAVATFFRAITIFLGNTTPRDAYRY